MPTASRWCAKKGLRFYATRTSEGINEPIMGAIPLVLALITTPALANVAGVASVIDGDTIAVHDQRIRLHGIDAPESRQLGRDRVGWPCRWLLPPRCRPAVEPVASLGHSPARPARSFCAAWIAGGTRGALHGPRSTAPRAAPAPGSGGGFFEGGRSDYLLSCT